MNYNVRMEAAWLVRDVNTVDDAIGVAISEAGARLNDTGLERVDITVGRTECPSCGTQSEGAFLAAHTAIVGLQLELEVYNAESEVHASRIAKSEVGGSLRNVPLTVLSMNPADKG